MPLTVNTADFHLTNNTGIYMFASDIIPHTGPNCPNNQNTLRGVQQMTFAKALVVDCITKSPGALSVVATPSDSVENKLQGQPVFISGAT